MKKNYTSPTIEKIAFRYRDQVVAASSGAPLTQDDYSNANNNIVGFQGDNTLGQCKLHLFEVANYTICHWL